MSTEDQNAILSQTGGFTNPVFNLEKVPLLPGQIVADFGAGSGAYAIAAAQLVGSRGRVYAIDVLKDLLDRIKSEANRIGFDNVEVLWGNVEKLGGSRLSDQSIDVVIASNILFQVTAPYLLAKEIKRVLKPGGQVLIIDWTESFNNLGPATDQVVESAEAERIFAEAGLRLKSHFTAGPHHYGLIFELTEHE